MAKGDHVQARRMCGLYYHHGIDMGDGTVIHFSGEPLNRKTARVARIPEEVFLDGAPKEIISHGGDEKILTPEETIALAEEQLDNEGYHLLYNNCEHFANYCKTRRKMSRQVQSLKKKAAAAMGFVTTITIVVVTNQVLKKTGQGRA